MEHIVDCCESEERRIFLGKWEKCCDLSGDLLLMQGETCTFLVLLHFILYTQTAYFEKKTNGMNCILYISHFISYSCNDESVCGNVPSSYTLYSVSYTFTMVSIVG